MADQTKCPVERTVQREESRCLTSVYKQRKWSDLTLINNDKRYMVHKIILAASIPHFENMLTIDMIEAKSNEINLDYPPEVLEMIIDWAYCQPITIKLSNARQLFYLADYMQINELTVECLDFLFDHSSDSVLTEVSHWLDQTATDEARKMLERYICLHFCDLIETQAFLNYDVDTVNYILSLDNLKIEDELDVFDAIIKWVTTNSQDRLENLSKLLRQIHWSSIDAWQFIDKVVKNSTVKNCEDRGFILKTIMCLFNYGQSNESKKLNLTYQPRNKSSNKDCLYALSRSSNKIEVIAVDIKNQYHKKMTELSLDDALDAPKFYDEYSEEYIINSSQIIRIDWKSKKVRLFKSNSILYSLLFGRVFKFETKGNGKVQLWKGSRCIQLADIPDYCSSIVAVAPYRGQFFIVGYTTNNPASSLIILKFDPTENIWSNVSTASYPSSQNTQLKMIIHQSKIILFFHIGNYWIYDLDAASWSQHSALSNEITWTSVSDLSIVLHNSKIFQCFKSLDNCILREVSFFQNNLVKSKEHTISASNHKIFSIASLSNERQRIHNYQAF